jgi:hypothetical protein
MRAVKFDESPPLISKGISRKDLENDLGLKCHEKATDLVSLDGQHLRAIFIQVAEDLYEELIPTVAVLPIEVWFFVVLSAERCLVHVLRSDKNPMVTA